MQIRDDGRPPDAELQQVFRLDGVGDRHGDLRAPGRLKPDDCQVARRISRRRWAGSDGHRREVGKAARVALLDARRQWDCRGQSEPARELDRRHPARQLQQRERVAVRLEDDPVQHVLVQPRCQHRLQQRPRIAMSQGLDAQLRQSRQGAPHLTSCDHERDALGVQAADHERERARRRAIEPRASSTTASNGCGAETSESRSRTASPTGERARRRSGAQPERDVQRVASKPGRWPARSRIGKHSWCSAANGSSISPSTPTVRRTRSCRPSRTVQSSNAVFPTPALMHDSRIPPSPRAPRRAGGRAPPARARGRATAGRAPRASERPPRRQACPRRRAPRTRRKPGCERAPRTARSCPWTGRIPRLRHTPTPAQASRICRTTRRFPVRHSAPPSTSRATTSDGSSGTSTGSPTAPISQRS